MRKGDSYTILFAAGICLTCSLLLSVTAAALKGRQDANRRLDQQRNVLKCMGVDARSLSGDEVTEIYNGHIEQIDVNKDSESALPLLLWRDEGNITKYAFPISGKGLWSTIKGFLALEADGETIAGISFYEHGETPGLGGEIEKPWFQDQFAGKQVWNKGPVEFQIVKGDAGDNPYAVDGISGATMTSRGVQKFLNTDLRKYDSYFSPIREDR